MRLRRMQGMLCAVCAFAFTIMGVLVQCGRMDKNVFMVVSPVLGCTALLGLMAAWEPSAFLRRSVLGGTAILAFATLALDQFAPLGEGWRFALATVPMLWVFLAGIWMAMRSMRVPPMRSVPPLVAASVTAAYTALCLSLVAMKYGFSGTSPDTMQQWAQLHGQMTLTDVHALGHTVFLKALLLLCDDPRMLVCANIVLIALLYGAFAFLLTRRGVHLGWILLGAAIFTACESPAQSYAYAWKDTPYTFVLGVLTIELIRLTEKERVRVRSAALIGALIASATLLRQNGIVVLLIVGIWLAIRCIRMRAWKQLVAMATAMIVCFTAVNAIGYGVLKAKRVKNGFSVQMFGAGLAAIYTDHRTEETDRAAIAALLDPEWMTANSIAWEPRALIWFPETNDPEGIFEDPDMKIMNNRFVLALGEHKAEIVKLYFRLLPKYPLVCLRAVLYGTYAVWGFARGPQRYYGNIFLLVLLMVGQSACRKRDPRRSRLIIFMPIIGNALSIAMSTITNEARYLLPTHALFPMLLLYLLCENIQAQAQADRTEAV